MSKHYIVNSGITLSAANLNDYVELRPGKGQQRCQHCQHQNHDLYGVNFLLLLAHLSNLGISVSLFYVLYTGDV